MSNHKGTLKCSDQHIFQQIISTIAAIGGRGRMGEVLQLNGHGAKGRYLAEASGLATTPIQLFYRSFKAENLI